MPTRGAPPLGGAVRGAPPGWRPATPSIYQTGSSGGSIYRDGGVNYAGPRRGRYTDAVSRATGSGGGSGRYTGQIAALTGGGSGKKTKTKGGGGFFGTIGHVIGQG